jgi:hypothetical protein
MSLTEQIEMLTRHREELHQMLVGEHDLSLEEVNRALVSMRALTRAIQVREARMPLAAWEKELLGI